MHFNKIAFLAYVIALVASQTCTCALKMIWDASVSRCVLCCSRANVNKVNPASVVGECNCVDGFSWNTTTNACSPANDNFCLDSTNSATQRQAECGAALDFGSNSVYNHISSLNSYSLANATITWSRGIPSTLTITNGYLISDPTKTVNLTLVFGNFTGALPNLLSSSSGKLLENGVITESFDNLNMQSYAQGFFLDGTMNSGLNGFFLGTAP